jgi:hypothetical protein
MGAGVGWTSYLTDVFRFLDGSGSLIGGTWGVSGIFYCYAAITTNGGYAFSVIRSINSCGNGTSSCVLGVVGSDYVRGATIGNGFYIANDGERGAVKLQLSVINPTSAAGYVVGISITFVGHIV